MQKNEKSTQQQKQKTGKLFRQNVKNANADADANSAAIFNAENCAKIGHFGANCSRQRGDKESEKKDAIAAIIFATLVAIAAAKSTANNANAN